MSHVINIKTKMSELKFLVETLKNLELKFQVKNVEQRVTIIMEDCTLIKEGAFIWDGQSFSFISDPAWSNEEQINRFLVSVNKIYNKISFVNLANQTNFIPVDSQLTEIKQTISLERFNVS